MLTSRLDAYISRYGDFCAHDDNNDTTDYFTPCACARGNNQGARAFKLIVNKIATPDRLEPGNAVG